MQRQSSALVLAVVDMIGVGQLRPGDVSRIEEAGNGWLEEQVQTSISDLLLLSALYLDRRLFHLRSGLEEMADRNRSFAALLRSSGEEEGGPEPTAGDQRGV